MTPIAEGLGFTACAVSRADLGTMSSTYGVPFRGQGHAFVLLSPARIVTKALHARRLRVLHAATSRGELGPVREQLAAAAFSAPK